MGSFTDRHAKGLLCCEHFRGQTDFSKLFWRPEPQVSCLKWISTPGLAKWVCVSQVGAPGFLLCAPPGWSGHWGLQKETITPSHIIVLPRAEHWDGALWLARWEPAARSSQLLCWHHLSKQRLYVHSPHCSRFTPTWIRSEPGLSALLRQQTQQGA